MIGRAFIATFRAVLADRSAFMLIVVSTILYSYPSAYSGEVAVRIPVAVVDLDNTGASRSLVHKLSGLQQADLVARLPSPEAADDWLRTRGAGAIVVVPAGFERRILTGGQGTVALYGNGAYLLRSSTALAGIGAAITAEAGEAAVDQAMAQGAPAPPALSVIARQCAITCSPACVTASRLLPLRTNSWKPSSSSSCLSCLLNPGWVACTRSAASVMLRPESAMAIR